MGYANNVSVLLDRFVPSRVCNRAGHNWNGGESMGPHNDGDYGTYYGLRYVIYCKRCNASLDAVPQEAWPIDGGRADGRFARRTQGDQHD